MPAIVAIVVRDVQLIALTDGDALSVGIDLAIVNSLRASPLAVKPGDRIYTTLIRQHGVDDAGTVLRQHIRAADARR